jgi:hypothetical protein
VVRLFTLPSIFCTRIYDIFSSGATATSRPGPPHYRGFTIHSDTPHSVGLLWTSDQPDAENSTWQNPTLTRDRYPRRGGIRTQDPRKRTASDPRIRPRGHWNRQIYGISTYKQRGVTGTCRYVRSFISLRGIMLHYEQGITKFANKHTITHAHTHTRARAHTHTHELTFCWIQTNL